MEDFKTADAASYDPLAAAFARFTVVTTQPLAKSLVGMADIRAADRVLDIGTGSGIVAIDVAGRLGATGRVTGIDLSRPMLLQARDRARDAPGASRLSLGAADAERLPFGDRTFDRVVSLFALLHFPNPERAIQEMVRVLKPGGRLAIGLGSPPPLNTWKGWTHYLARVPDALRLKTGRLLIAPRFLEEIVDQCIPGDAAPEETEMARNRSMRWHESLKLVQQSGLEHVRSDWEGRTLDFSDIEDFWELQRTFSSIARKRLGRASPAQVAEVRRLFFERSRQVLDRRGKLVYHYAALFISAQRPA